MHIEITAELSSDVLSHLAAEMLVPSAHRNGKIKSVTCPMQITVSGFATVEAHLGDGTQSHTHW